MQSRRREALLDPAQQFLGALVARGVRGKQREEAGSGDRPEQGGVRLLDGDLLALQVALHQVVVLHLGDDRLEQRRAQLVDQRQFLRCRVARDAGPARVVVRALVQQGEVSDIGAVYRQRDQRGDDALAEGGDAGRDHVVEARPSLVELGDRDNPRHGDLVALLPERDGGRVDVIAGGDDEDGGVGGAEPGSQLANEVRVTRRVEQVDLDVVRGDRREGEGGSPLGGVLLSAVAVDPGAQQVFEQGRLSRAARANEDDVAYIVGGRHGDLGTRL